MEENSSSKVKYIVYSAFTQRGFAYWVAVSFFTLVFPIINAIIGGAQLNNLLDLVVKAYSTAAGILSLFLGLVQFSSPILFDQVKGWALGLERTIGDAAASVHEEAAKALNDLNKNARGEIVEAGARVLSEVRGLIHTLDLAAPLKEEDINFMMGILLQREIPKSSIVALDWNAPSSWQSRSMFDYLAIQSQWMRRGGPEDRSVTRVFFWDEVDDFGIRTLFTHAALGIECFLAYRPNAVSFLESRHHEALRDALIWDPHLGDQRRSSPYLGIQSQPRSIHDLNAEDLEVRRITEYAEREKIVKLLSDLACKQACGDASAIRLCGNCHKMLKIPASILTADLLSYKQISVQIRDRFAELKKVTNGLQEADAQDHNATSSARDRQLCPAAS